MRAIVFLLLIERRQKCVRGTYDFGRRLRHGGQRQQYQDGFA
jgi:hypothetical protein